MSSIAHIFIVQICQNERKNYEIKSLLQLTILTLSQVKSEEKGNKKGHHNDALKFVLKRRINLQVLHVVQRNLG